MSVTIGENASIGAAHPFNSNFFLGDCSTAHGAHVPLAGGELPEKSAVAPGGNWDTIHKPFYVAGARGSEFDHLL
jgi:hypothetical protein